ncbi:MAG TPA: chemotaxis protein CheW [Polyangiaceae bacterium]
MNGELDAFASDAVEARGPESAGEGRVVIDILMFELADEAYAVPAAAVEGVVPWRDPAPVPGASSHVRGVIQDRGRIVAVLRHPTGRNVEANGEPRRMILCSTPEGLVGLPASVTRAVTQAEYSGEPKLHAVYASKEGAYTFVAPHRLHSSGEHGTAAAGSEGPADQTSGTPS